MVPIPDDQVQVSDLVPSVAVLGSRKKAVVRDGVEGV
jgi:hypothetical protein